MNLADELRKLQDLHHSGALTDAELVAAKAVVIGQGAAAPAPNEQQATQERLKQIELQNELVRLDFEWQQESTGYHFAGATFVPGPVMCFLTGSMSLAMGIFAAVMTASTGGPPWPLFLLIFGLPGIVIGALMFSNWCQYAKALEAYQIRRSSVQNRR